MFVHICCSVDSHFFLQKLRKKYPKEKLIGFFYNPNIHPYSEYYLRLLDVKRSCKMLGISLMEGEYDYNSWLEAAKGYENEPEKGQRCTICFDKRVEESMKKALETGEKRVTTTLLTSPKKSIQQLDEVGKKLAAKYDLEFVCEDFRIHGGTQEQFSLAKKDKLYKQDYCGCLYALQKQREAQHRVSDELFCSIGNQILPKSLQERVELYNKRYELEKAQKSYEIVKEKFLNYRISRGYIKVNKKTVPSYFIAYSYLKRKKAKLKIEKEIKGVFYSNREEVKFLSIKKLNFLLKSSYTTVKQMIYNPPLFEKEYVLRGEIEKSFYSNSPIVIVDNVDFKSFEIYCDTVLYQDVRENLVIF